MANYRVAAAEARHIDLLAPVLRAADRDEVFASHGVSPRQALELSVAASDNAWTGFVDEAVALMWGVCPDGAGGGTIWMLGSDLLVQHQFAFLRRSKAFVNCNCSCYASLHNMVDDRNTTSLCWLRWLGFTIGKPVPHGPLGMLFRPVWKKIRGA